MKFTPTRFADAWLIELEPIGDERGFFARSFCVNEFRDKGLETTFAQHSRSLSSDKGTLRGMHFQTAPHSEVKLVSCLQGALYDVIIDLRPASPTFRQWQGFELSAANRHQLYIPKGFAHGFQTLEENTEVNYLISEFYAPQAASGVRYNDPQFDITWPLAITVLSEKDQNWPDYSPPSA